MIESVARSWMLGDFKEIIPINTVASDFSIYFIVVEAVTNPDIFEVVLFAGEVEISRVRIVVKDILSLPFIVVQTPRIIKNTQIRARCANKLVSKEGITISLYYRVYEGIY